MFVSSSSFTPSLSMLARSRATAASADFGRATISSNSGMTSKEESPAVSPAVYAAVDLGTDTGSAWGASVWPNLAVAEARPRRTEVARADWELGWSATTPTEATIAREPAATARDGRGTGSRRQAAGM